MITLFNGIIPKFIFSFICSVFHPSEYSELLLTGTSESASISGTLAVLAVLDGQGPLKGSCLINIKLASWGPA